MAPGPKQSCLVLVLMHLWTFFVFYPSQYCTFFAHLIKQENYIFGMYILRTITCNFTHFQHSCLWVADLLVMYCDLISQKGTGFPNICLGAASAFHDINDVFDITWQIFIFGWRHSSKGKGKKNKKILFIRSTFDPKDTEMFRVVLYNLPILYEDEAMCCILSIYQFIKSILII